jgi:ferredoxin
MPSETDTAIRSAAERALTEEGCAYVVGYCAGTEAYRAAPHFADKPEECNEFTFNCACTQNLANYVPKIKEKIGIVAKGCDSRAIQVLLVENQVKRDQLFIIGVPCEGLVDLDKVLARDDVKRGDITGIEVSGEEVVVRLSSRGAGVSPASLAGETPAPRDERELRLPASEYLRTECRGCQSPTPQDCDVLIGEAIPARDPEVWAEDMARIEAMSPEERLEYFERSMARCIRCYACVRGCPMCYCTTCFAVQDKPQWLPRMTGVDENRMFHLGRALHLAGRCVDCGQCDRVCPESIPLRELNTKLAAEVKDLFGFVAGVDVEEKPPLTTFKPEDTEEALDTH